MPDLSHICKLHHNLLQHWILNQLSEAKNQTCVLMDASHIHFCWATMGNPCQYVLKDLLFSPFIFHYYFHLFKYIFLHALFWEKRSILIFLLELEIEPVNLYFLYFLWMFVLGLCIFYWTLLYLQSRDIEISGVSCCYIPDILQNSIGFSFQFRSIFPHQELSILLVFGSIIN